MAGTEQLSQVVLQTQWRTMRHIGCPLPTFDEVQFGTYSQNGEDGILLYVFTLLGTTDRRVVEICAGNGQQCNAANLILNHGWHGLLFDGNPRFVAEGRAFFASHPNLPVWRPRFEHAWITRDNVNDLIASAHVSGEIDLLSLDIDGNDYWILTALEVVQPRVIILEYQAAWGSERRVTQRYQPDFVFTEVDVPVPLPRCGASLAAFADLLRQRGYRLVGNERMCINAVFVRDDLGKEVLPEVPVSSCFDHPMARYRIALTEARIAELPDMWQDV